MKISNSINEVSNLRSIQEQKHTRKISWTNAARVLTLNTEGTVIINPIRLEKKKYWTECKILETKRGKVCIPHF